MRRRNISGRFISNEYEKSKENNQIKNVLNMNNYE